MDRRAARLGGLLIWVGLQLVACAWPDPTGRWDEPETTAPTSDDDVVVDDGAGAVCPGVQGIPYAQRRPNVMLLVDRSGSMASPGTCEASPCPSKWEQLLALGGYLEDVKQHARLGLTVFPDLVGDACSAGAGTLVPLSDADDIDRQILGTVSRIGPVGRTPIAAALDALGASGTLDDQGRDNVIVLLTDGQPNCSCSDESVACEKDEAVAAITRLVDRPVPITVDVVGFGASATSAAETLSAMAVAAGTALPGPVPYFQADTIEQLVGRLYEIAAGLAPCRYLLDELPDPTALVVHLDDGEVAACASMPCASGYSYDRAAGVVELHGETCQAIRDGACHSVWFETR